MAWSLTDFLSLNRGGTQGDGSSGTYYTASAGDMLNQLDPIAVQLGGQFALRSNSVRGWGNTGWIDNSNTQNLGTVTDLNLGALSSNSIGGLVFPFDVKLTELNIIHDNSNSSAQAWGWVVLTSTFTFGTNTEVTAVHFNECSTGSGLRNYLSASKQNTAVTTASSDIGGPLLPGTVIPAGTMVTLAVGAPTASATNYNVRIAGGYMKFERA